MLCNFHIELIKMNQKKGVVLLSLQKFVSKRERTSLKNLSLSLYIQKPKLV